MKLSRLIVLSIALNILLLGYLIESESPAVLKQESKTTAPPTANSSSQSPGKVTDEPAPISRDVQATVSAESVSTDLQPSGVNAAPIFRPQGVRSMAASTEATRTEARFQQTRQATDFANPRSANRQGSMISAMSERAMPFFLSAAPVTGTQPSGRAAAANTITASPIPMPAVLVENDPANPPGEGRAALAASLQQEFVDAIGGPDQDPADPGYLERWRKAVPENDQRFKALFGVQAFLERERSANLLGDNATAE